MRPSRPVRPRPLSGLASLHRRALGHRREPPLAAVTGITIDSRRCAPATCTPRCPGPGARRRLRRPGRRLGAAAILTDPAGGEPPPRPACRSWSCRPARAGWAARRLDLRRPGGGHAVDRHHRHLRQDHHRLPPRGRAAGGRAPRRADRHRRDAHRRRAHQVRAHHPRGHRPAGAVRGDARARRRRVAMEVSSHALVLGRVDGWSSTSASSPTSPRSTWSSTPTWRTTSRPRPSCSRPSAAGAASSTSTTSTAASCSGRRRGPGHHLLRRGPPRRRLAGRGRRAGPDGSTFTVVGPRRREEAARSPLPGPFNVANTLAAIVALAVAGRAAAGRGRRRRRGARRPGPAGAGATAAQYFLRSSTTPTSRTPSSRSCARCARSPTGRLHVVLGCGGDRDRGQARADGRRGRPARRHGRADLRQPPLRGPARDPRRDARRAPRSVPPHERGTCVVEPDRAAAIAAAVARAEPGDTVLVAGKGHEQGQDIAGVVRPSTTGRCCARSDRRRRDRTGRRSTYEE